jgi:hypothetical protein
MLLPSAFSCSIKRQYLFNLKPGFPRKFDELVRIVVRSAWRAFPYDKGDEPERLSRPFMRLDAGQFSCLADNDVDRTEVPFSGG